MGPINVDKEQFPLCFRERWLSEWDMNNWKASRDYERLNPSGGLDNSSPGWGDDIEAQQRLHQDTIARQDEDLDQIGKGVERLGEMSLQIHNELKDQNVMLGNLDEDFEDAMHGMDLVTKKTKELIRKSGGCKTFSLIVCLLVVLLFLFILVLFT